MNDDPFALLVLHHTRIDWLDPKWDRQSLSLEFMGGEPLHWASRKFNWARPHTNQFGPAGECMTGIEIERSLIAELPPRKWGGNSRVGKPVYQHMLTLIKLMLPKTDCTDTLADAVMFFCTAVGCGKHIFNLIGGQNMSKTAATVRLAFATMFVNPEFTKWTVANPFEKSAADTVWGEIEILWDDICQEWGGYEGMTNLLFPTAVKYQKPLIEFIPGRPRVARIELQHNKHSGKSKGAKSRKGADNEDLGIFGEIVDEVNEIDSQAWLRTLVNKSSQKNYIAITSQNFKDPEDMGGQITEPVPEYGGPDAFEKLNVDDDLWWHSRDAGITLRFDGHNAANILAKRVIYSYLFDEGDRLRIAASGVESPIYYSQVRSFPVQGATSNSLLSKPKLSASRHLDEWYTLISQPTPVSFCDPAFGGRDSAVYGWAKFGRYTVTDAAGLQYAQDLLVFSEMFITLKLVNQATWPGDMDYWKRRYEAVGLSTSDESVGAEISNEDQIALQCLEHNRKRGIPSANFGYDFSLRPDIVSSMNKILGFSSVAFNYNQPPEGVPLINFKGKSGADDGDSKAMCKSRNTELGMLAADMFLSRCVRGGGFIPTAITQLQRTHLEMANRKYVIEDKAAYKARWSNVSPDHRDVFIGIAGMAAMRGFRANLKPSNRDVSAAGVFSALQRSRKFRAPAVAKLPAIA